MTKSNDLDMAYKVLKGLVPADLPRLSSPPLTPPPYNPLALVILNFSHFLENHSYLKASNIMSPLPLTSFFLHIRVIFLS